MSFYPYRGELADNKRRRHSYSQRNTCFYSLVPCVRLSWW